MRKAHKNKVVKIFLKHDHRQHCLQEVKLSDIFSDFVLSNNPKKQVQTHAEQYILWECVNEEGKIGINEHRRRPFHFDELLHRKLHIIG